MRPRRQKIWDRFFYRFLGGLLTYYWTNFRGPPAVCGPLAQSGEVVAQFEKSLLSGAKARLILWAFMYGLKQAAEKGWI
jgi:hypothetical protein